MFARVGWAARGVAARTQPVNFVTRAVGLGLPRSFAKLPTAPIQLPQPGSLLHDLIAATDATTARKLLESTQGGLVKIRRDSGFVEKLIAFQALHGVKNAHLVTLCGRNSVAARMFTPELNRALTAVCETYNMSTAEMVTFMSNSVAKRLGTAEFDDALKALSDQYDMSKAEMVTFMSGSVAKRLGTPEFDAALKALAGQYDMSTAEMVTFMSSSVAKRLGAPEFDDALKALSDQYGMGTAEMVKFVSDSVAARLGTPEFDAALKALREYGMSTQQLCMMGNNSVAKRLGDEQYMSAMSKVIDCTGLSCSVALFGRNVFASRIDNVVDDFCALVKHCQLNGSSADDVSSMLGSGKLNSVIPQLWQRLGSMHGDDLQNAMAEYTGSYTHKGQKAKQLMA